MIAVNKQNSSQRHNNNPCRNSYNNNKQRRNNSNSRKAHPLEQKLRKFVTFVWMRVVAKATSTVGTTKLPWEHASLSSIRDAEEIKTDSTRENNASSSAFDECPTSLSDHNNPQLSHHKPLMHLLHLSRPLVRVPLRPSVSIRKILAPARTS
jgi:hypothetical protein